MSELMPRIIDRLSVAAYYDLFTFPLLDDHCPYPSDGNDSRFFMTWKQSPLLTWSLQLQHKYKEEQSNQGTSSQSTLDSTSSNNRSLPSGL